MICYPEEKGLNVICRLRGFVTSVGLFTDVFAHPLPAWFFQRTMVLPWALPFSALMCCLRELLFMVCGSRGLLWNIQRTQESIKMEWFCPGTLTATILFQFLSEDKKKKI